VADGNSALNGQVSLREYMAALTTANDKTNAERFKAIQEKLDEIGKDQADHETRIRTLEKKGFWSNVFDGVLALGTVIAGFMGLRAP